MLSCLQESGSSPTAPRAMCSVEGTDGGKGEGEERRRERKRGGSYMEVRQDV